jgi:hypothetical protein
MQLPPQPNFLFSARTVREMMETVRMLISALLFVWVLCNILLKSREFAWQETTGDKHRWQKLDKWP